MPYNAKPLIYGTYEKENKMNVIKLTVRNLELDCTNNNKGSILLNYWLPGYVLFTHLRIIA